MFRMLAIIFAPLLMCRSQPLPATEPLDALDRLVARIALYPDPLLAELLAASTYPLEVLEADHWVRSHPRLNVAALAHSAAQQDWDASVQVLVAQPNLLHRMAQDLAWADALGNAVLARQADVLAAVQRLRKKPGQHSPADAQLERNIIIVQQAGAPAFDQAFPESRGAVGWGWNCDWEAGAIAVNLRFFRRYGYAAQQAGATEIAVWTHSPHHRRTAPYSSAAVGARYRHKSVGDAARSAGDASPGEWAGSRNLSSQASNWGSAFDGSGARAYTRASRDRGLYSMGASRNGAGGR
jgi:hypothetical protein